MSAHDAIVRSIDFVENNLQSPITVADMATTASYSLYHFCRIFGRHTRHTPYDYLMRRRMTVAAHEVMLTERKIVDIAYQFQFDSHEGFTRAFHRMFTTSPTEARRRGWIPATRMLPHLTSDHLTVLRDNNGLVADFITLPKIKALRTRYPLSTNKSTQEKIEQIAISMMWPDRTSSDISDTLPPGTYSRFTLVEQVFAEQTNPHQKLKADIPLILDWITKVWLFHTPHELRLPYILITRSHPLHIDVPISANHGQLR